jgi:hypothetical protein
MKDEIKAEFKEECKALKAPGEEEYANVAAHMITQEREKLQGQLRKFLQDVGALVEKELSILN